MPQQSKLSPFLTELQRRPVFRVVAAYPKNKKTVTKTLKLVLLLPLLMPNQMFAQLASDYFPLQVGNYWVQRSESLGGANPTTFRLELEGTDMIGGTEYFRLSQILSADNDSSESGWYTWMREDTSGIVMGAFSETPEILEIVISTATITVDGDPTDWSGIDTLVSDPQGDDSPAYTGDDIQALYIVKDSANLYVRMDLWDTVNTNFGNGPSPSEGRYEIRIDNDGPYNSMHLGIAYDQASSQWSLGHNGSSSGVPEGLEGPDFVGVSGGVIEIELPLATIGYPSNYSQIRGTVMNCCVQDWGVLDEAGVSSITIFDPPLPQFPNDALEAGFAWEFDFLPDLHISNSTVSIVETVQVPAGQFNDCLKINAVLTNSAGDTVQRNQVYYAQGVGEVLNVGWNASQQNFRFELTEYSVQLSVGDNAATGVPIHFSLHQNYPNPFNPVTTLRLDLPQAAEVKLVVYDLLGREVVQLVKSRQQPGHHQVIWTGTTAEGRAAPTGIYIARLVTPEYKKSIKMVLLK